MKKRGRNSRAEEWKFANLFKEKSFYIGLLVLIAGIAGNILGSYYLFSRYGNSLPILPDIILDNIPRFSFMFYIYDFLMIGSLIFFAIYAFRKKNQRKIPYYFIVLGIYQILRAIFIIITPLGAPTGAGIQGLGEFFTYGFYPSGHTGGMFLFYLLSSGLPKTIFFVSTFIIIIALFLGKAHYSIDIFSALIFSYAIYLIAEKFLKKKFVIKD